MVAGIYLTGWVSAADAQGALVTGIVYDSTVGAPLGGAVVQVVHAERPRNKPAIAVADSVGRFSLGSLGAGPYLVAFAHPRLDSLGLTDVTRQVTLPDALKHLTLAVPNAAVVRALHCGPGDDSTSAVIGYARDAAAGTPLVSTTLTARWFDVGFVSGTRGLARRPAERRARSATNGWFVLCDLPTGGELLVYARHGADSLGGMRIQLSANGLTRHDVYFGARGATGRLVGSVRGADGAPLAGALVELAGTAGAIRTASDGAFAFVDAPLGSRSLTVRALGFAPVERIVAVRTTGAETVDVRLTSVRAILDTLRVLAARTMPLTRKLMDFEERRRSVGAGTALDTGRIRRANLTRPSDLFHHVPGATIVPSYDGRMGRSVDLLRVRGGAASISGGSPLCLPVVFLDRMPLALTSDLRELDTFLTPGDLLAVEFYPRGLAPMQFYRDGTCGSLVITTRW
jgi:hypothetical protein